ncbi:MAG: TIR domain-containing protein [Anaerolineae bacterium]|nr:TIR domain-containing protein [Anaerolineae bacterium]
MSSIFLSHNRKDKPFVRKLSERLRAHGIRTWVDEAEMRLGDSLLSKIETAIRECEYLGVVLSPHSVASKWVRREVNIALHEEIHGNRVKVLPLLYQPCDIPGFLADKMYADFTRDFAEGFEALLAHFQRDLDREKHKQTRAAEILGQAYQDWLSFDRPEAQLLSQDKLELILQHLPQPSLDLLEYLLCSLAHRPTLGLSLDSLKHWLNQTDPSQVMALFGRLLNHQNSQIRLGAITIGEQWGQMSVAKLLVNSLREEANQEVKRAGLRCLTHWGQRLPPDLAQSLLADPDWLVQAYALPSLAEQNTCLLVSDGTEFAAELGRLAHNAGFRVVTFANHYSQWELDRLGHEVLLLFKLVIMVRGEHYTQQGREDFYSRLRRFVAEGGILFATSWVSYETVYHHEFNRLLPFSHVQSSFNEDIRITCHASQNHLAQKLFTQPISYQTSVELLQPKEDSVVLLETVEHLPILGYRRFGTGTCYYLNSCQHSCFGPMQSPLQSGPALSQGLQKIFEQTAQTPAPSPPAKTPDPSSKLPETAAIESPGQLASPNPRITSSVERQITHLSRRLQKLREIQALKGIDTEPHYLIEIEDIEEKLASLQSQRKDLTR